MKRLTKKKSTNKVVLDKLLLKLILDRFRMIKSAQIFISFVLIIFLSSFIKERNVIEIYCTKENTLLFNGGVLEVLKLTDTLKIIIQNEKDLPQFPAKRIKEIAYIGNVKVSTAIISIANSKETEYKFFIKVLNEIERAYSELRNEMAMSKFKLQYEKLTPEKRKSIDQVYPKKISEAEPEWWYNERGIIL